jgi:hypothetical protein
MSRLEPAYASLGCWHALGPPATGSYRSAVPHRGSNAAT